MKKSECEADRERQAGSVSGRESETVPFGKSFMSV